MENTKIFKKISGEVIPPKTAKEPNNKLQFSDKYLAKIIINDNECYSIIAYDFKNQRWSSMVGMGLMQRVVEYYVEDLAFEKWVNEKVLKANMDILCKLFDSMDDEDK